MPSSERPAPADRAPNAGVLTEITPDTMREMCALLGLPPDIVRSITSDATHGVTAEVYVCGPDGAKLRQGDDALTAHVHVPLAGTTYTLAEDLED